MNTYLLTVPDPDLNAHELRLKLNRAGYAADWLSAADDLFFIRSDLDLRSLSNRLKDDLSKQRFLLVGITADGYEGWMPRQVWEFLKGTPSRLLAS